MVLGSLAPTLPLFLAAMGLGGGIGLGLTGMTTHAALIADAYVRRRGLATGIAFGGSMAAYALARPPSGSSLTGGGGRPSGAMPRPSWPSSPGRGARIRRASDPRRTVDPANREPPR